jgi:hypothetical protein
VLRADTRIDTIRRVSDLPVKAEPRRAAVYVPFSQRASLWGDLRISVLALVGALKQWARSFRSRTRR